MLDKSGEPPLPPGLALVWGFPPPARRGPKPTYTVAEIVDAAIALADEEGLAGLSLPKIARRLDLTPNALYRYVNSKDELMLLLTDAATGPPPDELPEGWRAGAAAWVLALIARYQARPWLTDLPVRGAPVTPNLLGWLESLLRALAATGLPPGDQLSCAILLDSYARSAAALAGDLTASDATPVQSAEVTAFLYPLLAERGYPLIAEMLTNGEYEDSPVGPDLEFGLIRTLDGIERLVEERRTAR
jgi:AcrR family transcriptional regulator